jgi:hypothetical protein
MPDELSAMENIEDLSLLPHDKIVPSFLGDGIGVEGVVSDG